MFFKAIYGEQQSTRKIYIFSKNHKLLEPLPSNAMKSSDFVADRSCFCLLRSVVYVQRLQSGVNSVSKPHLLMISSNFIRHSFPKNKIMFLKVVYNNSKRHIWEIFRVFEINALKSGWFCAAISCDFGPFCGPVKTSDSLLKSDFARFRGPLSRPQSKGRILKSIHNLGGCSDFAKS